jgi:hypothetical protein
VVGRGGRGSRGRDRHRLPGAGAALIAAACAAPLFASACAAPPADPARERLAEIADPRAAEVVARTLEAYGGLGAWSGHRSVEYIHRLEFYGGKKTPEKTARQLHRFSIGAGLQAYVEDLDAPAPQVIRMADDVLEVTRGGEQVIDPEQLEFPRLFGRYARWTFQQPWSLLESGSSLTIRSERTPPAAGRTTPDPCDVVRLTRERPDGTPPADWHDFYISQVSRLVDRVHSYRAEDGSYRLTVWSDHRGYDGVRVPTRRVTYASDVTGAIGALEVVVEYAEVRFDVPVLQPPPSARVADAPVPVQR